VTLYKNPAPMFSSEGKISLNEVTGDEPQRIKTIKPALSSCEKGKMVPHMPYWILYMYYDSYVTIRRQFPKRNGVYIFINDCVYTLAPYTDMLAASRRTATAGMSAEE
jgi:hypothetical protein